MYHHRGACVIEHQLRVVIELNGKPVPAKLARFKEAGTELMVHPAVARNIPGCPIDRESAVGLHAGE